jgi:DNA-binding LacI/PurR family transcriptional regulator
MSTPVPITQRDVAAACGVHPSTICLALKNSPSIPLLTRQRVQAVAEELGYRPNVAARNLALLRGDKTGAGSLPIAWLNQEPSRQHWRNDPGARTCFESARRRAEELGYHLEEIWTREPGMTAGRLVQIIRARGIEGVLLPVHRSFEFSLLTASWNDCALVGINDYRLAEWVDVVCLDHYRNAEMIFRHTRRMEAGRIGLALTAQFDSASNGLVQSCFFRHQADVALTDRVPVCLLGGDANANQSAFEEWLNEYAPEIVVTAEAGLVRQAQQAGYGPLWIGLGSGGGVFDGGVEDGAGEVASLAVDCVVEKMRRFERGVREATRVHLLRGVWTEPSMARLEAETVVA